MAENGKVGVEMANAHLPGLIICDIMMPELDGYGVLHVLSKRPETASIPFIFLSAKAERSDVRKGMDLGADDYLSKPFDETELLNAVEARLKKADLKQKDYSHLSNGLDEFINDAGKALKIKNFADGRKVRTFKRKSVIYSEGDYPTAVYFIKNGEVKTFRSHPDGKELITGVYRKNEIFGVEPVLQNLDYDHTASTLVDADIVSIPRQDFMTLMYSNPDVAAGFISFLCQKIADKEKTLVSLAYSSIRQRTAEALLDLNSAKEIGKSGITIAREDIARIVGTAPESVIRVLSEFKSEGLIETDGSQIKILQPTRIEKVVRWNVSK
jgi:CRP-like cAMP-binding protein